MQHEMVRPLKGTSMAAKESEWRLGYGLDDWDSIPGTGSDIFLSSASTPAREPTQPPTQRVPGSFLRG